MMVASITRKTFKCTKCGECCKPITKVSEEDIKRIEQLGHRREDFLDIDPFRRESEVKDVLKRKNGYCTFLRDNKDKTFDCTIYENRPQVCRDYPFFEGVEKLKSCIPSELVWYRNVDEMGSTK